MHYTEQSTDVGNQSRELLIDLAHHNHYILPLGLVVVVVVVALFVGTYLL